MIGINMKTARTALQRKTSTALPVEGDIPLIMFKKQAQTSTIEGEGK